MKILVTGGAGFIGSNFVRWALNENPQSDSISKLCVLDLLTYAGNIANLSGLETDSRFSFIKGDIRDESLAAQILKTNGIDYVVHFAAESHVDRSILDPLSFVKTNVEGTQVLLNAALSRFLPLASDSVPCKFLHVSTDEVYGSLGMTGSFTERTPLDPSSAYSASKAASDLLVLAASRTHGLNVNVTRCTNNYGPYQFPEKLIPLFLTNAMEDRPLPLYGEGKNIRSWLHVDDHSRALWLVLTEGSAGEVYNIGGSTESERSNKEVTQIILEMMDKPASLITLVEDRKGHDLRYSVDYSKIKKELGWQPQVDFEVGLQQTLRWYEENRKWWRDVKSGEYQRFYELNYSGRSTKN